MSNVRYLALRSQPVYERVLIDMYGKTLKTNRKAQIIRVCFIMIAFIAACISAVVIPMWGAEMVKAYIENFW